MDLMGFRVIVDDETDKIPNLHLGFCPLVFIPHIIHTDNDDDDGNEEIGWFEWAGCRRKDEVICDGDVDGQYQAML